MSIRPSSHWPRKANMQTFPDAGEANIFQRASVGLLRFWRSCLGEVYESCRVYALMLARPPLQHSKNLIQPAAMEQSMSQAVKTTDHDEIRTWAEERNGRPAVIRTKGRKGGVLRIDFGEPEDDLKEIEWDEFFEILDRKSVV